MQRPPSRSPAPQARLLKFQGKSPNRGAAHPRLPRMRRGRSVVRRARGPSTVYRATARNQSIVALHREPMFVLTQSNELSKSGTTFWKILNDLFSDGWMHGIPKSSIRFTFFCTLGIQSGKNTSTAPLQPQQFSKCSSRILAIFHKISNNIVKILQFSRRFALHQILSEFHGISRKCFHIPNIWRKSLDFFCVLKSFNFRCVFI